MAESGATRYLRRNGWMKLYRSEAAFDALRQDLDLAREFGVPFEALDAAGLSAGPCGGPQGGLQASQRGQFSLELFAEGGTVVIGLPRQFPAGADRG
jgi:hypothetical protein